MTLDFSVSENTTVIALLVAPILGILMPADHRNGIAQGFKAVPYLPLIRKWEQDPLLVANKNVEVEPQRPRHSGVQSSQLSVPQIYIGFVANIPTNIPRRYSGKLFKHGTS